MGTKLNTARQLLQEFWLPLLLAAAWTAYTERSGFGFSSIIRTFSPAFFLCSWLTGQVVRVSRQARTESGLRQLETRLVTLTANLDAATVKLVNTVTGGDAYVEVSLMVHREQLYPAFIQHGDFPVYGVEVRIVDVQDFHDALMAGSPDRSTVTELIGDLAPGSITFSGQELPHRTPNQDFNCFVVARNGASETMIRSSVVNGHRLIARATYRDGPDGRTLLAKDVPDGFPRQLVREFEMAVGEVVNLNDLVRTT